MMAGVRLDGWVEILEGTDVREGTAEEGSKLEAATTRDRVAVAGGRRLSTESEALGLAVSSWVFVSNKWVILIVE